MMLECTLYADVNADAPVNSAAWEAFMRACELFGNPLADHRVGQEARRALEQARASVALALDARPQEVIFVSGGTEANALALLGSLRALRCHQQRTHVVASSVEHASVRNTLAHLAEAGQIEVTFVGAGRDGFVAVESFAAALRPNTRLCTLMLASNETGVCQPVQELVELCRARNILVHADAVQAIGRLPLTFHSIGVDMLTISGHKIGAVGGGGALLLRSNAVLQPVLGDLLEPQAAEHRILPTACSMAAALTSCTSTEQWAATAQLREGFEAQMLTMGDVEILGKARHRLPNTSCIRFGGCDGDGLLMALDLEGIAISTGSACASGSVEPSKALLGMGLSAVEAKQTVRFSFGPDIGECDVERLIQSTSAVVQRMRNL